LRHHLPIGTTSHKLGFYYTDYNKYSKCAGMSVEERSVENTLTKMIEEKLSLSASLSPQYCCPAPTDSSIYFKAIREVSLNSSGSTDRERPFLLYSKRV